MFIFFHERKEILSWISPCVLSVNILRENEFLVLLLFLQQQQAFLGVQQEVILKIYLEIY